MRIRRASPLLLLLGPSLVTAGPEVLSNEEILALNHPPKAGAKAAQDVAGPPVAGDVRPTQTAKPYKGTEDAPVDGLDGKPHAGPFVDRTPEDGKARKGDAVATTTSKSLPTSLDNFDADELAGIPEKNDGVMNDYNRPVPKKGTTGTEGGISEKAKARKAGQAENKPTEPKEAPPTPHSAEEDEAKKGGKSTKDSSVASRSGQDPITGDKIDVKKDDGYGDSGYLMEKPTDLPEKPHDIPHPTPRVATSDNDFGPPVNVAAGRDQWLMDTMPETEGKTNLKPAKAQSATISGSTTEDEHAHHETWHEWFHSFVLSFTMIIFSEIGDKTFLVAALMAMRHSRTLVFSAALTALIAMTVLSAVLGHAFPALLPKRLTTFAAAMLFFVFGAKSLREGLAMDEDAGVGDEMREVEAELEEKEHSMRHKSKGMSAYELESGRGRSPVFEKMGRSEPSPPLSRSPSPPRRSGGVSGLVNLCSLMLSPAWVQTFIMTFLGEWGDRSQIATIAMAAGQDYWWVTLGAIVGHACCTGVAVVGGRALAGRVSMRVVTIGGAVAFLVFGCIYLYECLSE